MARKKCKVCLTCFNLVWLEGKRYYHCWLCNTWYEGRDEDLKQVEDPFININVPKVLEEQEETNNANL